MKPSQMEMVNTSNSGGLFSQFCVNINFLTFSHLNCIYQVPNCHLCPLNAPLFDLNQGNVSSVFMKIGNQECKKTKRHKIGEMFGQIISQITIDTIFLIANTINQSNIIEMKKLIS